MATARLDVKETCRCGATILLRFTNGEPSLSSVGTRLEEFRKNHVHFSGAPKRRSKDD